MKILALADLHIDLTQNDRNDFYMFMQKKQIQDLITTYKPDFITISGDIVERYVYLYKHRKSNDINLYKFLNNFFTQRGSKEIVLDIPIIFCLGNHEFAFNSVDECLEAFNYAEHQNDNKYNIHCLDIVGNVEYDCVNFVGNVLWYDGTCSNRLDAKYHVEHIHEGWLDATIKNFDALKENQKCIKQIKNGIKKDKTNILITHMVPLYGLNKHNILKPDSIWNVYSGHGNLFEDYDINVDIAISGHTHLPVLENFVNDNKKIKCYNVGNDYFIYTQKVLFNIIDI